jgi:hypothetical protein
MSLKAKPPKPLADDHDQRVAAIISGATAAPGPVPVPAAPQPAVRAASRVTVPWKAAHVRPDLLVQVNVRLPEPIALKLRHVSHMTDRQKQELVAEALAPLLDAKLRELGYSDEDL